MPAYSQKSLERLNSCHPDLITIFNRVIKYFDCTILEGHRGKEAQDKAYTEGKSKLRYPNGKHNAYPSMAVDATPYPVDLNNKEAHIYFGGFVMAISAVLYEEKKITNKVRWGGDFNMNKDPRDDGWDWVHYELIKP